MPLSRLRACLPALVIAAIVLFTSTPAFALCPNCYSSALGIKGVEALKSGILILLIPTTILFGGLIFITYRRRNPSYPVTGSDDPALLDTAKGLAALPEPEADRV